MALSELKVAVSMDVHVGQTHTFHYNSDGSGDVMIRPFKASSEYTIPFQELVEFVGAAWTLPKMIERLENTDYADLASGAVSP